MSLLKRFSAALDRLNDHIGAMPCEEIRVTDERLLGLDSQVRVFSVPGWLSTPERAALVQRALYPDQQAA